jgi:ABC-2 type transport system ATP-binding protein
MPILEVSELAKSYGSVVGVDGLTLSVEEGEIFGFLGPNGAGKTTTIRLVMRLLHPDRGSISLFGVPLRGRAASVRQRIGYLPGEFRPYVEMTGVRFLDYMARFRARAPKLRSDLLDRLEFAAATLERPIKHLSHGNRQKLGIVQALEHEPDLAILDEPTLGLDPLMQEAFYNIVGMLRDRGKCVFLSSHVLSEVEKVCERVAIIRDGSLVALESIEALRHKCPRRLIVVLDASASSEAPVLPGARLLAQHGERSEYRVDGDVLSILQALTTCPVRDVILPEPDLEDVFMAYYQDGGA